MVMMKNIKITHLCYNVEKCLSSVSKTAQQSLVVIGHFMAIASNLFLSHTVFVKLMNRISHQYILNVELSDV